MANADPYSGFPVKAQCPRLDHFSYDQHPAAEPALRMPSPVHQLSSAVPYGEISQARDYDCEYVQGKENYMSQGGQMSVLAASEEAQDREDERDAGYPGV